ncbi:MAG: helix-turn-helix transcriptional regulator [Leptospirales bacterium]
MHQKEYGLLIDKLIQARLEAGLTQEEAGKKLGWRQDYISKLESKQRRLDVIELADFAKIYKKPLEYFTGGLK